MSTVATSLCMAPQAPSQLSSRVLIPTGSHSTFPFPPSMLLTAPRRLLWDTTYLSLKPLIHYLLLLTHLQHQQGDRLCCPVAEWNWPYVQAANMEDSATQLKNTKGSITAPPSSCVLAECWEGAGVWLCNDVNLSDHIWIDSFHSSPIFDAVPIYQPTNLGFR